MEGNQETSYFRKLPRFALFGVGTAKKPEYPNGHMELLSALPGGSEVDTEAVPK